MMLSLRKAVRAGARSQQAMRMAAARFSTSETLSASDLKLEAYGINNSSATVYRNLSYEDLAKHEREGNEGEATKDGVFAVDTGIFTGRSPKDKWIVKQMPSAEHLDFGPVNQPVSEEIFDELYEKVVDYYGTVPKMYVNDLYCGASPASQRPVRFITELAWQAHFTRNMFIRPETKEEVNNFEPAFTVINACKLSNEKWKDHGLNSDVFVGFNIEKKVAIIMGTWYGGEMKKGIFSMMNTWLPLEGTLAMHCSANKGKDGSTALFFGLSGTGKTTLSADPNRALIGDDEHGWDDHGIFNFEGGCYAKTINLTEENEPEIYRAIKAPGALLENTMIKDGTPDYFDTSKTQNGRVSYPIEYIENFDKEQMGGHPKDVIFLTADAFGVLPPVSKLTGDQPMYHFLSGYTAKVAGTERGVTEPTATFSTCFGAAFMTLPPAKYGELLEKKIDTHKTNVYLVNTGWSGGSATSGASRMSIKDTRACINAILDGSILDADFQTEPFFNLQIPKALGKIDPKVLNPRDAWSDPAEYDAAAKKLADMFVENYKQFIKPGLKDFSAGGPPQN
ncbi:Phosphoenolpyruvate carboxykinase ATP [Hondaea fermentalgiana]|uniref:phosphoenolpyruvate carboxykinase (ATP) n=1 Tax=Hondaea fermentalgiana TaxID=2315210 RepID=A0A2R5GYY3_9STRA|nr:Phosphoenolpyruvate carboxykinase ATP [Hondaea fermentalgiana]|eukprot:GBG35028.1 Phosphoenolpyruvate carboxykinase ATP [Hondaea fermentalgiana]